MASSTKLTFGKYAGQTLAEVPVDYLKWIVSSMANRPDLVQAARETLRERGQDIRDGSVIVTLHAVDRFSTRGGLELWQAQAERGIDGLTEGIAHFLERLCEEAIARTAALGAICDAHTPDPNAPAEISIRHAGLVLCFARANGVWTLKTVKPGRRGLSRGVRQALGRLSRSRRGMARGARHDQHHR